MLEQIKSTGGHKSLVVPAGADTVVYVVPAGRAFNGVVVVPTGYTGMLSVKGSSPVSITTGTGGTPLTIPISLVAGDTVKFSATGASLQGVESWA